MEIAMALSKACLGAYLGLLLPFNGIAADSAQIDNSMSSGLIEVGRGEMDWLWFSLYRARLMTVTGQYQSEQYPQLLDIEYYREIDAEDLLKATKEQWLHLGFKESDVQAWLLLLKGIWPDVKEGDHLSFKIIDPQKSQFYFNQQPLGVIENPQFAQAFLAIWLSNKTSRPALRAQLLGEKSCDC
ncbi:chalcone isomerase family protein [Shewanella acanthi]|nr:chalcone isomerase family protein [Shewanella acanthi]